jgi:hypothetical protein
VERNRFWLRWSKGGACLLFLCLVTSATGQTTSPEKDQNQIEFEVGVRALFEGNYDVASEIFETLYRKTRATRVKLEWARAAFLSKQYELSSRLFEQVLNENIPDIVRFNIAIYLGEIAKLGNQTDYGFRFTRDTNPFAVSKSQQIYIYGIPFNYTPPQSKQTLSGLNFYLTHSRALNESGNFRLLAEVDDTEYEGENNNKSSLKLAVQVKQQSDDNFSLRVGIDHYFQKRELLLRQPYVAARYRKDQLNAFFNQYEIEGRFAKNLYPDFSYVNGGVNSLSAAAAKNIGNSLQIGGNLYFDDSNAETASQAFTTTAAGIYLRFFTPLIYSNTRINYARSRRSYKEIDELFIVKREDNKEFVSLSIQPYKIKILGLYPLLEVGYEKSTSNIPINSFDRNILSLSLRKNY